MTIQELSTKGHAFLDELAEVVFSKQPGSSTAISITADGATVLSHRYYADVSGGVTLDLRSIVLNSCELTLPSDDETQHSLDNSGTYLRVTQDGKLYGFLAHAFTHQSPTHLSFIDKQLIPEDFLIILTIPRIANYISETVNCTITYVDHICRKPIRTESIPDHDGYILSLPVKVTDLPCKPGVPFFLEVSYPGYEADYPNAVSSVFEVTPGSFEQYAFLDKLGRYEVIAMQGDLHRVPTYEFENVKTANGYTRSKLNSREVYEQNSGHITKVAADTLADLMNSDAIFRREGQEWKRILVESTSVDLNRSDTVHSFSFKWIYA